MEDNYQTKKEKRCQSFGIIGRIILVLLSSFLFVNSTWAFGISAGNNFENSNDALNLLPSHEVASVVRDSVTNESLAGVTIRVKGENGGAVTDAEGKFSIEANENDVLVFSFVGYALKELDVKDVSNEGVYLSPSETSLNQLVVVGYGSQTKRNVSSSITNLSSKDLGNSKDNVRIDQALKGKSAGVQVQQTSGQPGSAPQIRIRGMGSITAGNSPLWVIDGMPTTDPNIIRNIDLSNVENVSVLKDASATAIYGSRGSNGVIIVERKKGQAGRTRVSVNYDQGWSQIGKKIDVLNGPEEARFIKTARDNAWVDAGGSLDDPLSTRPFTQQYPEEWNDPNFEVPTFDYQDFVFRTAALKNLSVNVTGGSENVKFFVNGMYSSEDGVVKRSGFKHYSFNSNVDLRINKRMTLNISVNPSFTNTDMPEVNGPEKGYHRTIMSTPHAFSPLSGVPGSEVPAITQGYFATPLFNLGVPNFLWLKDKEKGNMIQANASLKIDLLDGLKYELFGGYLYDQTNRNIFSPSILTQVVNQQPHGSYNESREKNLVFNHILTYNKTFKEVHSLSAMIGYSYELHRGFSLGMTGLDFPTDIVETLNQALDVDGTTQRNEWSLVSFLGRINYGFKDKYLLNFNLRRDGSSRFGKNNQWGIFPSFSAGWVVSKEDFYGLDLINYLKIRGGWGVTGNNQIGDYTHVGTMGITYAAFGESEELQTGIYPNNPGNEDLTWERANAINLGVTVGIIKDRISLDFDVYRSLTKSLLIDVGLPAHSGFLSQTMNLGEVENKGVEFQINSHNLINEFKWETSLNVSFNGNKVRKLGLNNSPILGPRRHGFYSITEVGHPLGSYYLLEQTGVWNTQEEIDNNPHWAGARPGTPRLLDWNGDGVVDLDDRHVIVGAPPTPKYWFGIGNEFKFKNLDFSFFINGAGGNKVLDDEGVTSAEGDSHTEHNGLWRDFWESPENPGNGLAGQPNDHLTGSEGQVSTRSLVDASYFQLNNVTLGYTLPSGIAKKLLVENVRISLTGNNLWIHDNAPYLFNVEGQTEDSGQALSGGGYVNSTYPLARQIIASLSVIF